LINIKKIIGAFISIATNWEKAVEIQKFFYNVKLCKNICVAIKKIK
jgi:hypothetical protein